MKILILTDEFPPHHAGGSGVVAYGLAKEYIHLGHEVLVVTAVRNRCDAGVRSYENVSVCAIYSSYSLRLRSWVSVWNPFVAHEVALAAREFKPDAVHVHNVHQYLSYGAVIAVRPYSRRIILTCHDAMAVHYGKLYEFIDQKNPARRDKFNYRISMWQEITAARKQYNPLRRMLTLLIIRRYVDEVVAVSSELNRALADNGIRGGRVIYNGIDHSQWENEVENTRAFQERHRIGSRAVAFGGRLSGLKGALKIIEIIAAVKRNVPDAQLVVIGRREGYGDRMLAYAHQLGLEKNIIFTGWLSGDEMCCVYRSVSIVTVPSLYLDPFPTINLEAMACGTPVVATCFGGSPEIVEDGVTGYIQNPFDVESFAARITELLTDDSLRERFGAAGRLRVEESFTLRHQAQKYLALMIARDDT